MENRRDIEWKKLMQDFEEYLTFLDKNKSTSKKSYKPESMASYVSYLNSINKANGSQTVKWLSEALNAKDPQKVLLEKLQNLKCDKAAKTIGNWKSALSMLGDFVFGFTKADSNLKSVNEFDRIACQLVAQSAIFCPQDIYKRVKAGELGSRENSGNKYGSWYNCKYRRKYPKEVRGSYVANGSVKLDDNTYANKAIKSAVLAGLERYGLDIFDIKFDRYEACHIWPWSCYNEKYHTSVANLVLLPREIAGLTDHCKAVEDMLKYEAFRRFGFTPDLEDIKPGEYIPNKNNRPLYHKQVIWRSPKIEEIE